jgi:hypothetical protein
VLSAQKNTNAVSWLTLDELVAVGVEQLVLEELRWSISKQLKLPDRAKKRKLLKAV